ncbi:MAG: L-rhamnose isomerase [Spirochaetia bacterium]|nr:L-rhamnose isomerase [Spirochaetia bacterium]MCF7953588.1 L-rhamnose isomerase [Spirochaetales bacterium]
MSKARIEQAYAAAKEQYGEIGVDTEAVMEKLADIPISLHCWQGDDVGGFETPDAELSGGGIQVTGNHPGKARSVRELQKDLEKVFSLLPSTHRLNLHAVYGEFGGKKVDRDEVLPEHFTGWADWAKEHTRGLDFNGTFFSHPKAEDGFTLASKDPEIRNFWIRHAERCRDISEYLGKEMNSPAIHNVWVPDGLKDYPADRMGYRKILMESLDTAFSRDIDPEYMKDAVETKLFGIGSEAFVAGSHEFYMNYASSRNKLVCLDMGHFHPTELIADKISSTLLFQDELLLHVSRPMRWDSDHIVVLNDDIRQLTQEIIRSGRINDIHIGLDFFDATLNRIGAWVIGARAALKGLLLALLEPQETLVRYEEEQNYFGRLALMEQLKTMPAGAVWDYYCLKNNVIPEEALISEIMNYEKEILGERA